MSLLFIIEILLMIDNSQRYAAGTKAILDEYFSGRENYRPEDLIVHKGDYATKAYGQRK